MPLRRLVQKNAGDRNLDLYPNGCTNNWNNGCFNKGSMHYNHGSLHWVNNKPIPVGVPQ